MADPLASYSKLLSYVLRHRPDEVGLELDPHGWVDAGELLSALHQRESAWTQDLLQRVVETNANRRFELSSDGARIRARQGHSVPVNLELEALAPPDLLFHGTVGTVLDRIRTEGLKKMQRHHVHLSADVDTARRVGGRRGRAIVLEVDAAGMHERGHPFYVTSNGVWLTDHVPPDLIRLMD